MPTAEMVRGGLLGVCVGDALGLPVQFMTRDEIRANPVQAMTGYGAFSKPPGTWSDDSSLTFCLAESLCRGFDLEDIGKRFVRWMDDGYWSADGRAFDIGGTTLRAVSRLRKGAAPDASGDTGEDCNGNGSLMRTLPLAFYLTGARPEDLFERVHRVSAITHAHPASQIACGLYVVFAINLMEGRSLAAAYEGTLETCLDFYSREPWSRELDRFARVLGGSVHALAEDEVESGGYVVHTLEAALWCLMREKNYRDTVLVAVNLGDDTDTTAAVAGGLAGIHYGFDSIPGDWIDSLARRDEILALADRVLISAGRC